MSGKNLELSLIMRLRDLASGGFTRAQRDIQSAIGKTESATANLTRTLGNLGKARSAAEVLGIRTEHNIQREIQRTQAAYDRLQKSGTLSMREQARAAEVTRNKIRDLNNEMGKYTLGQRAASAFRTGTSIAAGTAAVGYVLSKPVGQTMDYGMRLAQMSNTAFTDRNTIGRIAGKRELNAAIVNAVRIGGGTREGAAETLDTLIASGAMSGKDAMGMLPTLTKAATASGADPSQLAAIGIRGMQTMGIKPSEMGNIIDMAITAGQAGGFELRDMAKWLPQQMAAAKLSGMSGTAGMAKLLAANQASAITAGTKDEAGNNLVNLLAKINSRDTAMDASKLGINLSGNLAAARGKGIDSLDAFVGIVDSVIGKDKNYQALQQKLKTAQGGERKNLLESQADILQGSAIGNLVQDRQALMALVGIMGNRDYMADVQKKTLAGAGATDKNFSVIAEEAGFKVQQAANEKTFATQNAFEKLTPLLGAVADGFSAVAKEYPTLTAGIVAATTALIALAAAAGAASVAGMLGGKGAGLTGLLSSGKGLVSSALPVAARAGSGILAGTGISAGLVTGVAYSGYKASEAYQSWSESHARVQADVIERKSRRAAIEKQLMEFGGETLVNGTKGYDFQQLQQVLDGIANAVQSPQQINLHIDGEQIATVVNNRNARTASRN